ncbi:WecB/TagA/CpsF family glycosyltransferase [Pseudoalteromonas ulvae]|nr:WecB/TagA/CpsF family glycosyltransferase [Pseudoalteromonas ulvae]
MKRNFNRGSILGLPFDQLSNVDTIDFINGVLEKKYEHAFYRADLNVNTIIEAQHSGLIRDFIECADIVNIDGMGIILACKLFSIQPPERVTGVDLFYDLLKLSDIKKYKVYFLGATQETIDILNQKVMMEFPNVTIAGSKNGYFNNDFDSVIAEINECEPDLLFIGMKSPEKEILAYKYKELLKVKMIVGVGGTFDVYTGKVKRAPIWIQNIGFEWLYRVYQEPRRMWKRYLTSNTKFLILLIKGLLK